MSFPRPTAGPYATGAPAADPRGVPGAGPGPGVCPTPVGRPQRRHSGCCFRGAGMILSGCLWGYSDIMSEYGVAILYLCRCYVFFCNLYSYFHSFYFFLVFNGMSIVQGFHLSFIGELDGSFWSILSRFIRTSWASLAILEHDFGPESRPKLQISDVHDC